MDQGRIDRLTDKQRTCLRLVYDHMSSKEIALRLGVAPGTIDQHVKAAMRTLDVNDRRTAARLLAEHEGRSLQPLIYQPLDLEAPPETLTFGTSTEGPREAPNGAMQEDRAVFQVQPTPSLHQPPLPLPIRGGTPSDLNNVKRLGWIFGLILLIAVTFGIFVTGFEALSRLGRALG